MHVLDSKLDFMVDDLRHS